MNDIQVFNNPEFGDIQIIMMNGDPWWIGKEVAEALGYTNTRKAIGDHVDQDDKNTVTIRDGISGNPNRVIINESGLYSLILSSKLPSAKKFKRWITSEVLPAIRKTGGYKMAGKLSEENYLKAAKALAECPEERLHYVAAILRQGGFEIPEIPVRLPKSPSMLPGAWNRRNGMDEKERDRMQYETLLNYPQFIPEYPEALDKHPELANFIPGRKIDNRPLQLQRSVSNEGYSIGFDRKKMKYTMEEQGMMQRDLADKSGICALTIRRYLTGKGRPGTINRNRICDALKVDHGYFDK